MFTLVLLFLALAAVIIIAAMQLAKRADRIAEQTGMGRNVAGLVLLAGATSLPEFSVGFSAVRMERYDLTAGDVLGSSLINLLILAVLDLVSRTPGRLLNRTAAAHALSSTVACLLTGLVALGMLLDSQQTILRLGPISWCVLGTYMFCARLLFLDHKTSEAADQRRAERQHSPQEEPGENDATKQVHGPLWQSILGFAVAAAVIFFAAPQLADTAAELAEKTGLGYTFFGTVFVALMTSLPEAISTFTALRLGTTDMAVGNILGSNAFNMVILALTDVATDNPVLSQVSDTHLLTAVCVIITTAVATLSLLYRAEKRLWIIEPDAALVALLVCASLYLVYINR
ncbi:MAG: sodium:calcium antiporter [Planctomycetaceae bacterium]|nr:sodium:calcium antiporter [Planctomycetaceae bacterium]